MTPLFITSSGTGIGKTALTTALCWQLRQRNKPVTALKPVISGYTPQDPTSDTALILQSLGTPITPEAIAAISPWRYKAPLAPMLAAQEQGDTLSLSNLVEFCRRAAQNARGHCIVEGVGGVMVPLNRNHTTADWMQALNWPVILVTGSYLGAVSHALSALDVLQTRRIPVKALVISESAESTVPLADTASMLELFVPPAIPVLQIPRLQGHAAPWTQWPALDQCL